MALKFSAAGRVYVGFPFTDDWTSDLTVACWVWLDAIGVEHQLVARWNGNSPSGLIYLLNVTTGNKPQMVIIDTTTAGRVAVGATSLTTGQWYHIAGTCPSGTSPTMRVYLNGAQDGTVSFSPARQQNGTGFPLKLGSGGDNTHDDAPLNGRIAEAAIWKAVLSANEIAALAARSPPPLFQPSLLKAYYPLHGASSTEADLGGGVFNGTTTSGTLAGHLPVGRIAPSVFVPKAIPAAVTPVADFTGTPLSGTATLAVTFTDSSTNTPTSWAWTFGDGGTSTSQNPSHNYTVPGVYTVSLVATNAAGSDTKTRTGYVTVTETIAYASGGGITIY